MTVPEAHLSGLNNGLLLSMAERAGCVGLEPQVGYGGNSPGYVNDIDATVLCTGNRGHYQFNVRPHIRPLLLVDHHDR